jgi:hypothetical protein
VPYKCVSTRNSTIIVEMVGERLQAVVSVGKHIGPLGDFGQQI